MVSNGSRFMVNWIIFANHLLEVGLTTVVLLYFIMYEDLTWIEIPRNSIWLRAQSHMISHYTWGLVTTLHDFGSVLGRPLDTFLGLSQFHGQGSWPVCEVGLNQDIQCQLLNWMIFSQWRQFLIQSKYIYWTSHKLFVCPNITYPTLLIKNEYHLYFFTYPTLDIMLYGSF